MPYAVGLVAELLLISYCLLDCLTTPSGQVRHLPKPVWLVLCVVPPFLGPLSWLLFGRPPGGAKRPARPVRASNPDDDEEFLRQLRQRAEEQRRRAAREKDDPTPQA